MKFLITLLLSISSIATFAQGPQTWPDAFDQEDVTIIKDHLGSFMIEGEIDVDKVLESTVFPFKAGDKTYTKEKFAEAFNDLFSSELLNELMYSEYYEVMSPEGDVYMNVCMNAPEGYNGVVVIFRLIEGAWMLDSMGLY